MQLVMMNRKLFRNFGFSAPLLQTFYLFTFRFLAFPFVRLFRRERKQKRESRIFRRFCLKTSVFVANKVLIFSDLWVYRVNCTLPPPFLALAGWVSSRPNFFYFFYFLFFVKYSDFINSAFLPNFEHF